MNTTSVLQNLATWVLWNSSGAAVLILLILGVRVVAGRAMSPRLRSQLWLLVVVRLMLPLLPAVSLSSRAMPVAAALLPQVYEVARVVPSAPQEKAPKTANRIEPDSGPQFVAVEDGMIGMSAEPSPPSQPVVIAEVPVTPKKAPINWLHIALVTWLAGTALLLGRTFIATIGLARSMRRLDPITDPKIVELLASCCELFRIRHIPRLLASENESAPALVGVIHPKILLPASLASKLSLDEIRLIFLHELAHLRRRDVLLNYLFAILTALHWFNPLLWIASWRMAADRELACDEAVLQVTSRRHARLYGCTILKLVELLNSQRLPAGAVGVVQHKALIQRRIDMIASYPSRTARNSMLVRVAALSLAIAAGVSAIRAQSLPGSPPMPEPVPAPQSPSAFSAVPTVEPTAGLPALRGFSADEIATVNPNVTRLKEKLEEARSRVDEFRRQGLMSNSQVMANVSDEVRNRQQQLKDYVADWNQKYTIQASPDGVPHAVRRDNRTSLLPNASALSASRTLPLAPGAAPAPEAPAAVGMGIGLAAPSAAPAPAPALGIPAASGSATPPAPNAPVSPGAGPSMPLSVDPAAPVPAPGYTAAPPAPGGALPPADPNFIRSPGLAPISSGENPYTGARQQLKDALAMYQTMYGADDPRVKQLEEQIRNMARHTPPNAIPMGGAMAGNGANRLENGATQSVEDASTRQANAEVMQKLAKNHAADFHGSMLRDALSYIADASGTDIVIDERTLSESNIDVNSQPVTMHVGSKPMEQILSLTLRLASPHLEYSIYNGVVFVSTRDALRHRIVTRIYDVPAKVDQDGMVQMITAAVDNARSNFFDQKIVVTAPEVAQRDVARLLAQLEPPAQHTSITGPGAMFMYGLHNAKASDVAAKFPAELGKAAVDDRTNSVLITTTDPKLARQFVVDLDTFAHAEADIASLNEQLAAANIKMQSGQSQELADKIERLNKKISEAQDQTRTSKFNLDELQRQVMTKSTRQADAAGSASTPEGDIIADSGGTTIQKK